MGKEIQEKASAIGTNRFGAIGGGLGAIEFGSARLRPLRCKLPGYKKESDHLTVAVTERLLVSVVSAKIAAGGASCAKSTARL